MKRCLWKSISSFRQYSSAAMNALKTGDILKESRVFTNSDISEYSKLTHDNNPLHYDLLSARNAGFNDLPVPGMLVASLFPRIIASHFPGSAYVKQTLEFRLPVFVGEMIIGEVQVISVRQFKERYLVKFTTTCFRDGVAIVIGGDAMAILPSLFIKPM